MAPAPLCSGIVHSVAVGDVAPAGARPPDDTTAPVATNATSTARKYLITRHLTAPHRPSQQPKTVPGPASIEGVGAAARPPPDRSERADGEAAAHGGTGRARRRG